MALAISSISCKNEAKQESPENDEMIVQEVNVYTHRHYPTDQELFAQFEKQTGSYKSILPVDNLNAGVYYFEFVINNEVKVIKFIKE